MGKDKYFKLTGKIVDERDDVLWDKIYEIYPLHIVTYVKVLGYEGGPKPELLIETTGREAARTIQADKELDYFKEKLSEFIKCEYGYSKHLFINPKFLSKIAYKKCYVNDKDAEYLLTVSFLIPNAYGDKFIKEELVCDYETQDRFMDEIWKELKP